MKCPNCGQEMPEGALYCEHCGKDIHIVPDYDPDLEDDMLHTILDGIQESMGEEETKDSSRESQSAVKDPQTHGKHDNKAHAKRRGSCLLAMLSICLLSLLLIVLTGGIWMWQHNSYDYQLNRAQSYYAAGDYEEAVTYYEQALEIDSSDIEVCFQLADCYLALGNKLEYEYWLRSIIHNAFCTQTQLERAYGKLIAIYQEREEYDIINEILQACDNSDIRTAYQSYMADPPEFSYEAGTYDTAVPLKLTSATTGQIYYTLDGTEPTEDSLLYTAPILLSSGTVTVTAIFVNDYGVVSESASCRYVITIELEDAPQVSVASGEYSIPMLIEVSADGGKEIYYTTDGSDPSLQSSRYTGPIPMPLGVSTFAFACVAEDGTVGRIARRDYELNLETELSVADAQAIVTSCMLESGKLLDEQGHYAEGTEAIYLYTYQYVVTISGWGDYYVVAEILQDESGAQARTGSYYAVEVNTGECYKLQIDGSEYTLLELITNSEEESENEDSSEEE